MPQAVRSRLAPSRQGKGWIAHVRRAVRAARHHSSALFREFRTPVLGFLVATVVGGFVYGELYAFARGVSIPLIDRPYVVLQLMLLEAPENVPPEWYLAAFWYALPAIFIVLVGLGAADFIELFFNRDEQRDPWSEALAMTYRNHVIVLGAGHVGLRVVRDLTDLGREVVVIDQEPDADAEEALEALHVPIIRGDATRSATLEKARLRDADVFVACTGNDRVNLEVVMKVRELHATIRIVARTWDRTYASQMERFLGVQCVLSAADLSAPAFAGAAVGLDITQTIEIRGVEYSMVRLQVSGRGSIEGQTVAGLQRDREMDVVLLARDGEAKVQPEGSLDVRAGDDLVIFAPHARILELVRSNRSD